MKKIKDSNNVAKLNFFGSKNKAAISLDREFNLEHWNSYFFSKFRYHRISKERLLKNAEGLI